MRFLPNYKRCPLQNKDLFTTRKKTAVYIARRLKVSIYPSSVPGMAMGWSEGLLILPFGAMICWCDTLVFSQHWQVCGQFIMNFVFISATCVLLKVYQGHMYAVGMSGKTQIWRYLEYIKNVLVLRPFCFLQSMITFVSIIHPPFVYLMFLAIPFRTSNIKGRVSKMPGHWGVA